MNTKIKPLYQVRYRNRSHARIDFGEFTKSINSSIRTMIPPDKQFKLQITDHFLDRLMDRNADPEHVKRLIRLAFERNLCEVLYFLNVEHTEAIRICFTDLVNHVLLSCNREKSVLTLRSFVHNNERFEARLNPEFTVNPFKKLVGDQYEI